MSRNEVKTSKIVEIPLSKLEQGKGNVILTNNFKGKFPHNLSFFSHSYLLPFRYVKIQVLLQVYSNKILDFAAFSIGIDWLNSSP